MPYRAIVLFAILHVATVTTSAQPLPSRLRDTLVTHLGADERQIRTIEHGGVVSYTVETGSRDEVMLVGIARIWATPQAFVQGYRNISEFESAPGVIATGKFSQPPAEADMKGLSFPREDIDELKYCKPGKCAFKIGDHGIRALHSTVDWNGRDYPEHAAASLRRLWLQYLLRYQATGDEALMVYHDSPKYFSVAKGLDQLLAKATALQEYSPHLLDYLSKYPGIKDANSEEFFYWQVGKFGLKPVHRITHVVMQRAPASYGDAYVIASKMLFASHYFRSGLEFRYLIPGQDQRVGGMHYLIAVQRSYVDGLSGFKGRFVRPVVLRRSRNAMAEYIARVKAKVEKEFNRGL